MKVSQLLNTLGSAVQIVSPGPTGVDASEVVLDDGMTTLASGQIVLGVRENAHDDLVDRAVNAGCAGVVLPTGMHPPGPAPEITTLQCGPGTSWTQLFVLMRTMLLSSHDEAAQDAVGPTSVHGLADAIATMMGASVVLYDRAHRVIAYSVQGHEIDDVRRDAILGRRTPEQWVRRFTVDRTAYQTFDDPGQVVTVSGYSDLRTRLRIAVLGGADVLGEISVAEGNSPLPDDAEQRLLHAANLAAPVMLWHRRVANVDELARSHVMAAILRNGSVVAPEHPISVTMTQAEKLVVIGVRVNADSENSPASEIAEERIAHFLTLHMKSLAAGAQVIPQGGIFFAVIPAERPTATVDSLLKIVLQQLRGMKVEANAAVSLAVPSVEQVPGERHRVEDLLSLNFAQSSAGLVLRPDREWASLVIAHAVRSVQTQSLACPPLKLLHAYDEDHTADLVATLRVYLDEFGSVSGAAATLFVHTNTMRHRLTRIEEIAGIDLTDPTTRLALDIALRATA